MERESRLMGRIADWMEAHGRVLSDRQRSNAYTGVRIWEIEWCGRTYRIVDVDVYQDTPFDLKDVKNEDRPRFTY